MDIPYCCLSKKKDSILLLGVKMFNDLNSKVCVKIYHPPKGKVEFLRDGMVRKWGMSSTVRKDTVRKVSDISPALHGTPPQCQVKIFFEQCVIVSPIPTVCRCLHVSLPVSTSYR